MAARTVLAIDVVADAADAVAGLDDVGDAARRMADEVDRATADASQAAGRLDAVSAGADTLDDKAGRATGALGALSAGFELVGAEKYAAALQGAAMATDFFSGVGQAATLITEAGGVAQLKARAATLRATAATKAHTAATKAAAVAQRVLNLVMRANPIGLVIAAITLLVAGFILAYKRSETFRNIVQAVMRAASAAVGWLIDKVTALIGWVKDKLPAAWRAAKAAISTVVDIVKGYMQGLLAPVQAVIDKVQDLIGWIKDIDFPDIPNLNPFNRRAVTPTAVNSGRPIGDVYAVTVNGALDPDAVARQIEQLLRRRRLKLGQT